MVRKKKLICEKPDIGKDQKVPPENSLLNVYKSSEKQPQLIFS